MITRRQFLKISAMTGAGALLASKYGYFTNALAESIIPGLSDPSIQPKFKYYAPNALNPGFIYQPKMDGSYNVSIKETDHITGLVHPKSGKLLKTRIWGYGYDDEIGFTWPGRTFQVQRITDPETTVRWENLLSVKEHLLPVDTSLHWAFSLPGYENYSIKKNGVPIVTHVHGGHTNFEFDGNPEFFYTPDADIVGPSWFRNGLNGFIKDFKYDTDVPAGTLWYHDHALGITRLNVYAGLAGFFIVRDEFDTGLPLNPLDLPAYPYELAYAIQDRMFRDNGELFYPAFPGDPAWADFITGEGLADEDVPQPSALAEFFGDHMVVNGVIWPKEDVEPRNYRMRLLNGTDSRFMVIQFFEVPAGATDFTDATGPLPFTVIGSDQGLVDSLTPPVTQLLSEPGSRYDIIFDFKQVTPGSRVIMKNIGGDAPFGGYGTEEYAFDFTDRVMAFDVVLPLDPNVDDVSPTGINFGPNVPEEPTRLRKVALFEGLDEFGRLQPLLGTAEPATDYLGAAIDWPSTDVYSSAKLPDGTSSPLTGPMEGSIAWHSPTTENPAFDTTEEWEIWNATGDAHPVHLHLVHFEVLGRKEIVWDSATDDEEGDRVLDPTGVTAPMPNGDGTYLVTQPTVQHNSVAGDPETYGMGFRLVNLTYGANVLEEDLVGYVENAPKDMVTALPDQITRIKAKFDKRGRYVWHCHILSHEDHEMMRVLEVSPGA